MNTHFVRTAVILLFCGLLCSSMMARVEASDNEVEVLTPLTDFGTLGVEDLETNYYGLVVEWTKKSSLDSNLQVEVCYIDPRLALASDVLNGNASEESLDQYVQELAAIYASRTPFTIKLSHNTDVSRLNLEDWKVTLANDKGEKHVLNDMTGGQPELRTSYSRGNFHQADYDVSFSTSGYQFLDSTTKWMKLSFSRGSNLYEIVWDFQAQASALESNVFETTMKVLISAVTILLLVGLTVTRPKVSALDEDFRAHQ